MVMGGGLLWAESLPQGIALEASLWNMMGGRILRVTQNGRLDFFEMGRGGDSEKLVKTTKLSRKSREKLFRLSRKSSTPVTQEMIDQELKNHPRCEGLADGDTLTVRVSRAGEAVRVYWSNCYPVCGEDAQGLLQHLHELVMKEKPKTDFWGVFSIK
jgi:hypothetical protein